MELENKHLSAYLPWELNVLRPDNKTILEVKGLVNNLYVFYENGNMDETFGDIKGGTKPILYPLDLTKPITHKGETFVPLIKLAAIAGTCEESDWIINTANEEARHKKADGCSFRVAHDGSFIFKMSEKWKDFGVPSQQLRLFNLLFEWRFDMYDLIRKGLAIDVNTLEINPYIN